RSVVAQGPFAESREQLGGYYVVDAADLDEAIALAVACPALATVGLGIEIRPVAVAADEATAPGEPAERSEAYPGKGFFAGVYAAGPRWSEQLRATGRLIVAEELAAATSATSVRLHGGKPVLGDGPFFDRADQLAGYAIVGAADLEAAARAASACDDRV